MSTSIYNIYLELSKEHQGENTTIPAKALPFNKRHKMGISKEGNPLFFITCSERKNAANIDMELINVRFNELCQIKEKHKISEDTYIVVGLKTSNLDYVQYFIEVVVLVLQNMNEVPTQKQVTSEINNLIDLFSSFKRPSKKTILGLWGELFLIENSSNPTYLIESWHSSPNDKFDFNDGKCKIEVKCTSKGKRIHRFSYDQLQPIPETSEIVASIMVVPSGNGKNIFQLKDSIMSRITSLQTQIKVNQIIADTLGSDFEKAFDYSYDYQMAQSTMRYYYANDIPRIPSESIPVEIDNVSFDCDLSNIPNVLRVDNNNELYKCLSI